MNLSKTVKSFFVVILLSIFLSLSFGNFANAEVKAKTEPNSVYLFTSLTCPHCKDAEKFLDSYKKESNPDLQIHNYNFAENSELINEYYQAYFVPANKQGLVPAIFVGNEYFVGFSDSIEESILSHFPGYIKQEENDEKSLKIPIFGKIDPTNFSLPILAITLGIVDGFNVCSLGALMVILGLVIFLGSRKRVFFIGGIFIATTAVVYGTLIFLWHQFFSFIAPYMRSMEMFIGILALAGGVYLLKEFYQACKHGPVCSSNNLISRLTPKIENVLRNKTSLVVILGAVIIFSAIVTIIEFPCSAFLPVLFTGILVETNTSFGMSLFYMFIYMLFYLLDEIIIFFIAFFTLKIKIVSPKFIIFFNLLAALIFIFLGVYYLFI